MSRHKSKRSILRRAFSLLELLVVITILGIIAYVVIPRLSTSIDTAKNYMDAHQQSDINTAVERWYLENGVWPAADLSDIAADSDYLPDGLPTPPQGGTYSLNSNHRTIDRHTLTGGRRHRPGDKSLPSYKSLPS